MKQYSLGPNGAIITSLNLFSTKFEQVIELVQKRAANEECEYVLLDTPGQIEVFTWSASGSIITETLVSW
jgi:GTPase SAR1 family protein